MKDYLTNEDLDILDCRGNKLKQTISKRNLLSNFISKPNSRSHASFNTLTPLFLIIWRTIGI